MYLVAVRQLSWHQAGYGMDSLSEAECIIDLIIHYTIGCYQCSSGAQRDNRHLQLGMAQMLRQRASNYKQEMC